MIPEAACSPEAKIEPAQSSLIGDLAKAAVQLMKFRADQISPETSRIPRPATASRSQADAPEEADEALVAALDILRVEGIEPNDVAKMVSKKVKREVTTQWLSKNLGQLGIRAVKYNGRRVFIVRLSEIQETQVKLGIAPLSFRREAETGQQGQQGQQPFEDTGDLAEPISTES